MALNSATVEFAMCLCATLAAQDIAEVTGMSTREFLASLLTSDTGDQLFDDTLRLWWDSPRDTVVACLEEQGLPVPQEWEDDD